VTAALTTKGKDKPLDCTVTNPGSRILLRTRDKVSLIAAVGGFPPGLAQLAERRLELDYRYRK